MTDSAAKAGSQNCPLCNTRLTHVVTKLDCRKTPPHDPHFWVGKVPDVGYYCRGRPTSAAHATGALVSTETLIEACRTLGECTPDYCAGASEPPTCRFCWRLDTEEPCLLDPIRQEAEGD